MELRYLDKGMKAGQSCAATIGFFDGVHQGHQYLLRLLVDEARQAGLLSCVITFDRHPRQVLQTDYCPRLLTTFEERNPTGQYRRTFVLPDGWLDTVPDGSPLGHGSQSGNGQTFLRFEGVMSAFYVWINGHRVGYSQGSMEPSEFNITQYLKNG